MNEDAREALLGASLEARARGDIGKDGFVSVGDWLVWYANKHYPEGGGKP